MSLTSASPAEVSPIRSAAEGRFMVLLAGEGKIILHGIFALVVVVALIIYLPLALVREVTRNENDVLPEWMGTVRGRRMRLRIVFAVPGALAVAVWVVATLEE